MSAGDRIAFDARYVNDRYHGIGRYAFRLLEGLVAMAPDREFVVFKGPGKDSRFDWSRLEKQSNIEFRSGPWPLYWPREQVVWPRSLRQNQVGLFFSPSFPAPLFSSVPQVITVHDLIFDRYPTYMPSRWARPYYRLLMKMSSRKANAVVAVSQATRDDLVRYYKLPPEKIVVVPEGVDPHFHPVTDEAQLQITRERYGLSDRFILVVGVRRPHKNLARLVCAFAGIDTAYSYQLVFVGPQDRRFPDEACLAAEQSGVNGRARFLDWVTEADLPKLYSLATLLALPSIIEGFGLPALEAMACGTPVLAANSSSLPEVVGQAGLFFDPYDIQSIASSLQKMLLDEDLRSRLASSGKERASTFTWESTASQILAVFDEVVN